MNATEPSNVGRMARLARSIAYGAFAAAVFPAVVMLGLTMSLMIFGALAAGPGAAAAVAPFSIYAVAAGYAGYGIEGVVFGLTLATLHFFRLRWLDWRIAAGGVFTLMVLSTMSRGPDANGPGVQIFPETVLIFGGLVGLILMAEWLARRDLPRERPVGVSSPHRMTAAKRLFVAATYMLGVPMLTALPWWAMEMLPFPEVRGLEVLLLSFIASAVGAVLLALVTQYRVRLLNVVWTQLPVWSLLILGSGNDWDLLSMIAATSVCAAVLVTILVGRRFEGEPGWT